MVYYCKPGWTVDTTILTDLTDEFVRKFFFFIQKVITYGSESYATIRVALPLPITWISVQNIWKAYFVEKNTISIDPLQRLPKLC